jgi:LysR family glycine cleavage system transcriptional activator
MQRFSMAPRLPPLSWLRAFEAAARHLSFTHAARELNLTQAAISKQVKLLEQFLRQPLFVRRPRSLILTKIGAAYLPKVQDGFERLISGTHEVFGSRRNEILTVRAPAGFSVNWMAPRLPKFIEAHPKVDLCVLSSVWGDELDKERYDLDIRYGEGHWPGFKADRLSWERLSPICTPEVAARLHTPHDLANERLLHLIGYKEGWGVWLAAAGATDLSIGAGMHFDTALLAFEVAAKGAGVALGRTSMSEWELESGRMVQPFDLNLEISEAFYLLTPDGGMEHPDAPKFRAWITAEAMISRKP